MGRSETPAPLAGCDARLVGQGKVPWRVLADPEGNEFRVLAGIR
jgi:hypothetical protein